MDNVKNRKHQNLLQGTLILGAATMLVKIIGAIYKIPLGWALGGVGSGYFSIAYNVYLPIYTLAMAGLPVAVSRMVAESVSEGRFRDARNLFKLTKKVFIITGLVCFVILSGIIAIMMYRSDNPVTLLPLVTIAPSIIFCCIMSIYRGYYEGLRNMYPTGISQVIEALGKLFIGLGIAYSIKGVLTNEYNTSGTVMGSVITPDGSEATLAEVASKAMMPYVAAGAILGITLGSAFGVLYLVIRHRRTGDNFTKEDLALSPEPRSTRTNFKMLVAIAVPIVLGSMISQLTAFIDLFIVTGRLESVVNSSSQVLRNVYDGLLGGLVDKEVPTFLYGCYTNYAYSLYNLAPTITSVVGVSAIPILATAWKSNDKLSIKTNLEATMRLSSLIALPAGAGLLALSQPILGILYPTQPIEVAVAAPILRVLGLTTIFSALTIPATSMLQAIGRQKIPVYNMIVGAVLKIVINFILVGIPEINIVGAPLGTATCYCYIFFANLAALCKYSGVKIDIISVIVKPFVSAVICGVTAYGVHMLVAGWRGEGSLTTIISVAAAAVSYLLAVGFLRTLTKNDIIMLPKGQKLAKILEKIRWIS